MITTALVVDHTDETPTGSRALITVLKVSSRRNRQPCVSKEKTVIWIEQWLLMSFKVDREASQSTEGQKQ